MTWLGGVKSAIAGALLLAATAAAGDETIWSGRSDGFSIDWRADELEVSRDRKLVLSFRALADREWRQIRERAGERPLNFEKTYAVASAVGGWLSVRTGTFCECGGAHPTAVQRFYVYDLRASAPDAAATASLASLFPADAIVSALLANASIAEALKGSGGETPRTLAELLAALASKTTRSDDCDFSFSDLMSNFAVRGIEGDKALVSVGLLPEAEICRGQTMAIDIWLPVSEALRAPLLAASDGSGGLLTPRADEIAAGRTTSFAFSSDPQRK